MCKQARLQFDVSPALHILFTNTKTRFSQTSLSNGQAPHHTPPRSDPTTHWHPEAFSTHPSSWQGTEATPSTDSKPRTRTTYVPPAANITPTQQNAIRPLHRPPCSRKLALNASSQNNPSECCWHMLRVCGAGGCFGTEWTKYVKCWNPQPVD